MDSKNTIAAIALSSAVIVLYSLFFVPEKSTTDQSLVEKEKIGEEIGRVRDVKVSPDGYIYVAVENEGVFKIEPVIN